MNKKQWTYKNIDNSVCEQIMNEKKFSKLVSIVYHNRMDIFEDDVEGTVYDPFLLKDMKKATERINFAVENNEHITIYGDYDADGVTSTSILYMYLKQIGAGVDFYIPDRVDEGYGINATALDKIKSGGTKLIITVDTGISAIDDVAYATELGIDVIITDHHECGENKPNCCAVIDPKQPDCEYPFKELAGVGVVFKLITALNGNGDLAPLIKKYMPLVCLGTIADVAPLIKENRAFVIMGLKHFSNNENEGINALLQTTNLIGKQITSGNIGFIIAPRINAAGRLGSANKSVELFLCNDKDRALNIATELSSENILRQTLEKEIFNQAIEIIEKENLNNDKIIVVANSGWHHGVIGIVSSKITEKYYKPSILISIDGDTAKASGRSISNFNLFNALNHVSDTLIRFGGHSLAAGLSIETAKIERFRKKINKYADEILTSSDFVQSLNIDYDVEAQDLTVKNVEELKCLEPYGMGNPAPVFSITNAQIKSVTTVSDGKHLKLNIDKNSKNIEVIGFFLGDYIRYLRIGDRISVAGTLDINNFRDENKIQMIIRDMVK